MKKLMDVEANRSGEIDLFRTISMLMVVILHTLGHGGVMPSLSIKSANWFVLGGMESLCVIAVNCFALTTGFLYVGKKVKIKNILNLYLQVFSFSFIIAVCFFALGKQEFSLKVFLGYLLPIASGKYWYFSAYFILFLMIPLLNVIIENINKQFMYLVLIVAVVLFGCYAFVVLLVFGDTFRINHGYNFIWLAILYLFGGTIRKYEIHTKLKSKKWLMLYFVSALLSFICGITLSILKNYERMPYVGEYIFLFNLLSSCLLLLFFASIKIKSNKIIEFFAKNSFGVYLLHEHPFIREAFITNKFTFVSKYNPLIAILTVLAIAVGIYLIGAAVEVVRKAIFKVAKIEKLTNKIGEKIVCAYSKIADKHNEGAGQK